jgi:hypothetical protein
MGNLFEMLDVCDKNGAAFWLFVYICGGVFIWQLESRHIDVFQALSTLSQAFTTGVSAS